MKNVFGVWATEVFNEYGYPVFVPATTDGPRDRAIIVGACTIWEAKGLQVGEIDGLPCIVITDGAVRAERSQYDISHPASTFRSWVDGTTPSEDEKWWNYILNYRIGCPDYAHDRRAFVRDIKAGLPARLVLRRQALVCPVTGLLFYEIGSQPPADYGGYGYVRLYKRDGVKYMRYEAILASGGDPRQMVTPSIPKIYHNMLLK